MTGRTHAVIGANVVWLTSFAHLSFQPLLIPIAALAALLPDLDASESLAKHLEVSIGDGPHRLSVRPLAPVAIVFSALFRHRGWLHSWLAIVVIAGLSTWLLGRYSAWYPLVITLGYASHLVADALTKHGIEFLLPIKRSVHLLPKHLRLRTGGILDTTIFICGCLTLVAYILGALKTNPLSF